MQIKTFKKSDRLHSKISWLDAHFYFSFGNQYDPNRINFGALLVVNDDIISAHSGFGAHSHRDMEIITIPLSGTLSHKDSLGSEGDISEGEVQAMTAGTGLTHSEYNHKNIPVNSFQIWIRPVIKNLSPVYSQKKIKELTQNSPQLLVSPDGRDDSLIIHQDAFISLLTLDSNMQSGISLQSDFKFDTNIKSGIFLTCVKGSFSLSVHLNSNKVSDNIFLNEKDWVEISDIDVIENTLQIINFDEESKILCIQVPVS